MSWVAADIPVPLGNSGRVRAWLWSRCMPVCYLTRRAVAREGKTSRLRISQSELGNENDKERAPLLSQTARSRTPTCILSCAFLSNLNSLHCIVSLHCISLHCGGVSDPLPATQCNG